MNYYPNQQQPNLSFQDDSEEQIYLENDSIPSDSLNINNNHNNNMSKTDRIRRKCEIKKQKISSQKCQGKYCPEDETKLNERMNKKEQQKMKNRVSAQQSRDKMKEYVDNLKSTVEQLMRENEELQQNTSNNVYYICQNCQKSTESNDREEEKISNSDLNIFSSNQSSDQLPSSGSSSYHQYFENEQAYNNNIPHYMDNYNNNLYFENHKEEKHFEISVKEYERVKSPTGSSKTGIMLSCLLAVLCVTSFSMNGNNKDLLDSRLKTRNLELASTSSVPMINSDSQVKEVGMTFDPFIYNEKNTPNLPIQPNQLFYKQMEEMVECLDNNLLNSGNQENIIYQEKVQQNSNYDENIQENYSNYDNLNIEKEAKLNIDMFNATDLDDINNISQFMDDNDTLKSVINAAQKQQEFINKTGKVPTSIFCPITMKFNYNNSLTIMEDHDMKELKIIINSQGLVEYSKKGANFFLQTGKGIQNSVDDILGNREFENSDKLYEIHTQIIEIKEHVPNPCSQFTSPHVI